jgi:hypothetical protein
MPIAISDGGVPEVALALQPAASLSGQVVVDLPAAGRPVDVGRYTVSLEAAPGTAQTSGGSMPGRIGEDGRFTVFNVMPGRYRLRLTVSQSRTPGPDIASVTINGRNVANGDFEIAAGTNVEGVVVRIKG